MPKSTPVRPGDRRRVVALLGLLVCVGIPAQEAALPNHALNVSWGDQVVIGKGAARLDSPEHIREALTAWHHGCRLAVVYWRLCSWTIANYCEQRTKGAEWYYDRVQEAEAKGDIYASALASCRDLSLPIYGYITLFDEGSPTTVRYGDSAPFPWQSHFTIEHPEFLVCNRDGTQRQWGVMEYWHPEVRQYKRGQIRRFLDTYDYDGIYLCTRSHSPPAETADTFGFNEPVANEYRRRHGADPRTQEFDLQTWRDLRGEGLTLFLREVRAELSHRGKRLAIGIPRGDIIGPPYGNMTLPWRQWLAEHLVDELVIGVQSGNFHYPSQKGKDRDRGYLVSGDDGFGLAALSEDVGQRYAPACRAASAVLRLSATMLHPPVPGLDGCMLDAGSVATRNLEVTVLPHPALDLQTPAVTIEFSVWPQSGTEWPRLLSKYNHVLGDEGRGWEIMLGDGGRLVFRLAQPGVDLHARSAEALPERRWTRVRCGFDGPGQPIQIWLDDRLSVEREVTAFRPRAVPVPLALGRYAGGGRPFAGRLCGVRIWDCGPAEIDRNNGRTPLFALRIAAEGEQAAVRVEQPPGLAVLTLGSLSGACCPGIDGKADALRFGEP
jgi:hypothetical protein